MASRIGMSYRNEQAQARIDAALATIASSGVELPAQPPRHRDPNYSHTQRLEWIASVLETLTGQDGERVDVELVAIPDFSAWEREDLDGLAAGVGVEDPGALESRREVIDAIMSRVDTSELLELIAPDEDETSGEAETEGSGASAETDTDEGQEQAPSLDPLGELGNDDYEQLSPQQKAARTRAANRASEDA